MGLICTLFHDMRSTPLCVNRYFVVNKAHGIIAQRFSGVQLAKSQRGNQTETVYYSYGYERSRKDNDAESS